MKTSSINFAQNSQSITYKGNMRSIYDAKKNLLYRTTTYYFRGCTEWNKLANLLITKYRNVEKVNIIDHACSSGAEADSIAMILISKLGEKKAKKFFPIQAKDIDKKNIEMAKNYTPLNVIELDIERINYYTNNGFYKFMDIFSTRDDNFDLAIAPRQDFRDNIHFEQSDIFEDVEKLPPRNNVFLCRNLWLYLNDEKKDKLAQNLSKKLDDTSILVIGEYDDANEYLTKHGFIPTKIKYVYTKPSKLNIFKQIYQYFYHILYNLKNNDRKPELL